MGTYSTEEYMELFGGLPEPGEAHPSLEAADNLRKRQKEEDLTSEEPSPRDTPTGGPPSSQQVPPVGSPSYCGCCGAPKDAPCAPWCEANR